MNSQKPICMVAYTEYSRDPRVRRYAEALASSGYQVECFVLNEDAHHSPKVSNIQIHHLNMYQYRGDSNVAYILSYLLFFLKVFLKVSMINMFRYKVIHVHNMPDFLVFTTILNKLFGAKIILDIHDTMPEIYKAKFQPPMSIIFFYILLFQEKLSCWYSDLIINVHQPHLDHNVRYHGLNIKKAHIISNYADMALFNQKQFHSNSKSINSSTINLIYHGTIAERFGLNIVLHGIKKVIKDFPNVCLNIYGKGDGVQDLIEMIKVLQLEQHVKYHGQIHLSQIPKKISNSDIGIVSYHISEATDLMLPLKLMENVAMGLPTMTVKNKAITYHFQDDELAYYDAGDSNSFSNKLKTLLSHPDQLKSYAIKASEVNKRLNWDNEKNKYLNIIASLLNNVSPTTNKPSTPMEKL